MSRTKLTAADTTGWKDRIAAGATLEELAAEYNVSVKYVGAMVGVSASQTGAAIHKSNPSPLPVNGAAIEDEDALIAEIDTWTEAQGTVLIDDIRREFGLSIHQWNQIAKKIDNSRITGRLSDKSRKMTYTDADIKRALKRVFLFNEKQPLSMAFYSQHRNPETEPSVPTIHNRYGSWRAACAAAKIKSGGARHDVSRKSAPITWSIWSDEQILVWVRQFWDSLDPSERPSYNRYEVWQRNIQGAPSGSLVRVRLRHIGTWGDIIDAASKVEVPVAI